MYSGMVSKMKVLFAINNENTVDSIIKHYKLTYGEKIDATKGYGKTEEERR